LRLCVASYSRELSQDSARFICKSSQYIKMELSRTMLCAHHAKESATGVGCRSVSKEVALLMHPLFMAWSRRNPMAAAFAKLYHRFSGTLFSGVMTLYWRATRSTCAYEHRILTNLERRYIRAELRGPRSDLFLMFRKVLVESSGSIISDMDAVDRFAFGLVELSIKYQSQSSGCDVMHLERLYDSILYAIQIM